MTDRAEVAALHEDEVRSFLTRVGLADAFDSGHLVCAICGRPLNDAGLGAARAEGDTIVFSCTLLDCLDDFQREPE